MLEIIVAVLISLWSFGFFAFHLTLGFINIILVTGIVLLVLHLLQVEAPPNKESVGLAKRLN